MIWPLEDDFTLWPWPWITWH